MIDTEMIYQQSIRYYVKRIYRKSVSDKIISTFTLKNSNLESLADYLNYKLDINEKPKKAEVEKALNSYFTPFRRIFWTFGRNN